MEERSNGEAMKLLEASRLALVCCYGKGSRFEATGRRTEQGMGRRRQGRRTEYRVVDLVELVEEVDIGERVQKQEGNAEN